MSFLDRLRTCRYVSPSGVEHVLLFDDLERSGGKKAPVHELPHRNVADVQDLGNKAETYPLSVYFRGADYDVPADALYKALHEKGRAKLKHPRWGDIDVLPTTWSQTEKFVDGLRVSNFQIDFVEAPDPTSLTITTTTAAAILASADAAAVICSSSMAAQIPTDAVEVVKMKGAAIDASRDAMDSLNSLTADFDDIRSRMAAQQRSVERDIDTLAAVPIDFTDALIRLIRMPADVQTSERAKAVGYAEQILQNIATIVDLTVGGVFSRVTAVIGGTIALAGSTATGTLLSRSEAMDTYNIVTDTSAEALAALEGFVLDPAALAALRQLCSDARARLLVESYSLPTERTMVLQGDTTPVQFAKEKYGDPEQYNRVIDENSLKDSAIFVIPRGTEMRWYE